MRRLAFLIVSLAAVLLPPQPCDAAPSPGKRALMRIAYPQWNARGPWSMQVPLEGTTHGSTWIAATPALAIRLDASHLVLLVKGVPTGETGQDQSPPHAAAGHLGAVWFVHGRRGWIVIRRHDDLLWAGGSGDLGIVAPFDLGPGHRGVSVLSGDCWMGGCQRVLDIFELDADHARRILPGTRVASGTVVTDEDCAAALHPPRGQQAVVSEQIDDSNCFDIASTWRLRQRTGTPRPDLVLHFRGRELVRDAATKVLSVRPVDETQVFRYADGRYVPVRGGNPTRDV